MKLTTKAFSKAIEKSPSPILVLHGDNTGLVIKSYLVLKALFDEVLSLDFNDFSKDVRSIMASLGGGGLFSAKKLLRISFTDKDKIDKVIEDLVGLPPGQSSIVFTGPKIDAKSSFRKWAEKEPNVSCVLCEPLDQDKIEEALLSHFGSSLDFQLIAKLSRILPSDSGSLESEMNKIETLITLKASQQDILESVCSEVDVDVNQVLDGVMNGNVAQTMEAWYATPDDEAIFLLRALSWRLARLRSVMTETEAGQDFENAIKILRPPLLFSQKSVYRRLSMRLPFPRVNRFIEETALCESRCKIGIIPPSALVSNLLLQIAVEIDNAL